MERLSQIRRALLRELTGNEARLSFVNTRLILTIGVDINSPTDAEDRDPNTVRTVLVALKKMGFLKEGSHV